MIENIILEKYGYNKNIETVLSRCITVAIIVFNSLVKWKQRILRVI